MNNFIDTLERYNSELYQRLIPVTKSIEQIEDDIYTLTKHYLPKGLKELYQTFNGTKVNVIYENALFPKIEEGGCINNYGFIPCIEAAMLFFDKNKKKLTRNGLVHFPIVMSFESLCLSIILNKERDNEEEHENIFQNVIIHKNPIIIYNNFQSFIDTTIKCYENGAYKLNSGILIVDHLKANKTIAENNSSSFFAKI